MYQRLTNAKPEHLQLWMITAGIAALGLGVLFSDILKPYGFAIFILGFVAHLMMMFFVYQRK